MTLPHFNQWPLYKILETAEPLTILDMQTAAAQLNIPFGQLPASKTPRPYRMPDIRTIRENYTKGTLKGPQMARVIGRTYKSFRSFLERNPELRKGKNRKQHTA